MLVDVIQMRCQGEKVPREQLLREGGRRGELDVCGLYGRVIATLKTPWLGVAPPGQKVPMLYDCRIRSLRGNAFVLHGAEYIGMAHDQKKVPQAWLCKALPESERPPAPPPYQPMPRPGVGADVKA